MGGGVFKMSMFMRPIQGWTGPPGYREIPGVPVAAQKIFLQFYYLKNIYYQQIFFQKLFLAAANIGHPSGPKFI